MKSSMYLINNECSAQYLNGPRSLTVHRELLAPNRIVYVFGEVHGIQNTCPNFASDMTHYFQQLFTNTVYPLDFFLENSLLHINDPRPIIYTSPMHKLRDFQINTYRSFPMVRSHYIDPRAIHAHSIPFNIFDYILKIFLSHPSPSQSLKQRERILEAFYSKDLSNIDNYVTYVSHTLLDSHNYIGKEISRSELREQIITFILSELETVYSKFYPKLHKLIAALDTDTYTESTLKLISSYVNAMNAPFVDAYLLSRMFKYFKTNPEDIELLHDTLPMNMIIYAGDDHANRVRRFLETQNFEIVEEAGMFMNLTRCLDITSIIQPFFSAYHSPTLEYNP